MKELFLKKTYFREELEELRHEKVLTDFIICESRPKDEFESKHPKYVYDALKQQPNEVCIEKWFN